MTSDMKFVSPPIGLGSMVACLIGSPCTVAYNCLSTLNGSCSQPACGSSFTNSSEDCFVVAHGAACDATCDASMTNGKCKCLADVSRCDEEEEGACVCCRSVVCHAEGGEEGPGELDATSANGLGGAKTPWNLEGVLEKSMDELKTRMRSLFKG